ncbi:MAG: hypothetical protein ACXVRS_15735 [Gaiellaceae bacterium]
MGRFSSPRKLVSYLGVAKGRHGIAGNKSKALHEATRELSWQAEAAYRRLLRTGARAARKERVRRHQGAASSRPSKGKPRGRLRKLLRSALRNVNHPHPIQGSRQQQPPST